jgi:hypothetical protein
MMYYVDAPVRSPSDLAIDVDDFTKRLAEKWPSTKIEHGSETIRLGWVIEDGLVNLFDGQEYASRGSLHADLQTISFDWPSEFVLWYRRYIPATHSLYFFDSVSWESLKLTGTTSMKNVRDFVERS